MVSKFTKVIMMVALALLVCSEFAMAAETKADTKAKDETKTEVLVNTNEQTELGEVKAPSEKYFIRVNGITWCLFIMLYLALTAAWKIVEDNQPDTVKDSILYAKFLTQTLAQKPN